MSKAARIKNKSKRDDAKRKRRAANREKYKSVAGTEANRKHKNNEGGSTHARHTHVTVDCGNTACSRCYTEHNDPLRASRGSCLYGKRYTSPVHRKRLRQLEAR